MKKEEKSLLIKKIIFYILIFAYMLITFEIIQETTTNTPNSVLLIKHFALFLPVRIMIYSIIFFVVTNKKYNYKEIGKEGKLIALITLIFILAIIFLAKLGGLFVCSHPVFDTSIMGDPSMIITTCVSEQYFFLSVLIINLLLIAFSIFDIVRTDK